MPDRRNPVSFPVVPAATFTAAQGISTVDAGSTDRTSQRGQGAASSGGRQGQALRWLRVASLVVGCAVVTLAMIDGHHAKEPSLFIAGGMMRGPLVETIHTSGVVQPVSGVLMSGRIVSVRVEGAAPAGTTFGPGCTAATGA